jgi:ABC-type multidrug transport system fused ATPase/permease subunit
MSTVLLVSIYSIVGFQGLTFLRLNKFSVVRNCNLCDSGSGGLQDAGISMENLTAVYESTKPRFEGKDATAEKKKLAEQDWEISLLKAQLKDAEMEIKDLTTEDTKGKVEKGNSHSDDNDVSGGEAETPPSGTLSGGRLCLRRINFECTPGKLIAVVGGVGAGK